MTYDPRTCGALCDECPLQGRTVVPPETRPGVTLAVVAEAPGEQEEKLKRPLVGPSGREFEKALRSGGMRRADCHLTNALLCRPPDNDLRGLITRINKLNREELAEAKAEDRKPELIKSPLECCGPRLQAEIARFTDFITLGRTGTQEVTGAHGSILALRGGLMTLDRNLGQARELFNQDKGAGALAELADDQVALEAEFDRWKADNGFTIRVMPTIHPAFVLRAPRWTHVLRNDVAKAGRWFRGVSTWVPPRVIYNPSPEVLRAFLADPERIYTYDVETDSIESLTAKIRCIAIGDTNDVVVIGFRSKDRPFGMPGLFLDFYSGREAVEIRRILVEFFHDTTKMKAGHNAGVYDRIVLREQMGVDPQPVIDTIMLHRNVESELPHSLAFVASLYTEAPSWKCYDSETEVLTEQGWVGFPALEPGVAVAQWNEGQVSFAAPLAYLDKPHKGEMCRLESQAADLLVTPDHKMVYRPRHNPKTCRPEHREELRQCEAQALPKTGHLPHAGVKEGPGEDQGPRALLRLIVAFQADGTWMYKNAEEEAGGVPSYLDFGFTKARKTKRLTAILTGLGMPYKVTTTGTVNPRTRVWVTSHPHIDRMWALLGPRKHFGPWLLRLPLAARKIFLAELPLWDGTKGKEHTNYNTADEVNADWVQACAVISGQAARKYRHPRPGGGRPMFRVSLPGGQKRRREWSQLSRLRRTQVPFSGRVYCVEVPAGFLLVRRRGKVTVSGNCDREGNKLALGGESDEQLHLYCANDVVITARCLEPLIDQVALRDQSSVWHRDQRIQAICADMHTVGMYVDQERRLAQEKKLLKTRHVLLTDIRDRLGISHFNPGSVPQMRGILFGQWKLDGHLAGTDLKEKDLITGSGEQSTGDLILRTLLTLSTIPKAQREIIKLIRRYRKCLKILGTYVVKLRPWNMGAELGWDADDDWVNKEMRKKYGEVKRGIVNPRTGRMYPGYNAHVAVTGRLSSSKPINAQNVPNAQRAMVVAQPGNVLVGADMDQLELRIAAALWGVELYLRAFAEGKDPHSMTAFSVFGTEFCKAAGLKPAAFSQPGKLVGRCFDANGVFLKGVNKDAKSMRDLSKAVQYASQYMAAVETVHQLIQKTELPSVDPATGKPRGDGTTDLPYAKLPLRRVRKMRDNWLRGAKEFEYGWEREIKEYRCLGYLREPVHGRRRDFLDGEDPNQIVNFKVQSSAAALMNNAIIQLHDAIPLHKWGPGTGIINQCHDSIVVECPESEAKWVAGLMEECMNQTHPKLPRVKFSASADIAHDWKSVG